jgi:ribose 5-phosphate isomerase RpiB
MEKSHDFVFGINIPINIPTESEIDSVKNNLEKSFSQLIDNGYMTLEETVAYVKFATNLAAFVPFTLDGFLETYRANVENLNQRQDELKKNQTT